MRWLILMLALTAGCDSKKSAPQTAAQTTAQTIAEVAAKPDEALLDYYKAMAEARFADAYAMVSANDRGARTLESFTTSASDPLQLAIINARSYEVVDVTVTGDNAQVKLDTSGPDIATMQAQLSAAHMKDRAKPDGAVLKAQMIDYLKKPDAPVIIMQQTMFLVKEDGAWKLDFDWDGEHKQRALPITRRPKPAADAGAN